MSKKITGIFAAIALILSLVGANTASALTAGDISMLQAAGIISAAQAASLMAGVSAPTVSATAGYAFTRDLQLGSKGADVTALQQGLVNGGYLSMPAGVAFGNFGALTKAALIKYQLAKGIAPAAGYFGPKTRGIFSAGSSMGGTTGTVISGSDLSVSLSATSPLASALIAGQSAADLAEFTFANKSAAPAVVTNVTLQRMGVSADTSLVNVYLYNGATRITDAASVSAGKISFNAASGIFTVPAGSSITISVRSDIDSSANGQLVAVALTGVTASLPVSAVYPISGSSMSVFSSTDIAKATSTITAGLGTSITAGSMNQTIWSTALSLSGRAVYLKTLALKVIGSIPSNSLQNVKLYVAGIQVASAMGMDSNGMITFDLSSAPYKIDSSRTLEVRADVVNGSSRTFSVSIQNASDMQLVDSNYNVGITVATAVASTGTFTVSTGSVTASVDSSLSSSDVVTGSSNVALARYTLKAYGEDMKISWLQASSTDQLDNVSLYANGVQIGSTKTISTVGSAVLYSLGSSLIIPAGQSVTIEIRGDIKYNGTNSTTSSNTIIVALAGYANNAQGSYSAQLVTVPVVAGITGPTMTVVGAGLTVAKNTALADQTTVPNTTGIRIGSYVLRANSSEAVRVTNLTVALGGTIVATTSLNNLYVSVGGVNTNPVNPQSSNNFSVDFTIPANTSKVVDIYADVASATGVATTSLSLNGYGTGSNITVSASSILGQTITVNTGTIANPTLKTGTSYSPASQYVVGNTTSVIGYFNFVASNGGATVKKLIFAATGTASTTNISSVIITDSNGDQTASVVNGIATFSSLVLPIAQSTAGVNVPVKVVYNTIASQGGYPTNMTVGLVLTGMDYQSGNITTSTTTLANVPTATASTSLMTVVGAKPVITLTDVNGTLSGGSKILAKITIAADGGPISLKVLPLAMLGSATAVSTGSTTVAINGVTQTGVVDSTTAIGASVTTGSLTFTNGLDILPGSPVTLDIIRSLTVTASPNSVVTQIGAAATFGWIDTNGSSTEQLDGTLIYGYPTTQSSTLSN